MRFGLGWASLRRMSLTLLQISDPHLSAKRPLFQWNWEIALEEAARIRPDLIVVSGDLSLDGSNDPEDLAFAAAQCARLPAPWLAIPGNHDIGDGPEAPASAHPITSVRIALWREQFGRDWWDHDFGRWRLIGINAHLIGAALPEEAEQELFLERALAQAGKPILFFLHLPPFALHEGESENAAAAMAPQARERLAQLLGAAEIAAIACGHVHQSFETYWGGRRVVWAPSTSMVTRLGFWAALPGRDKTGLVEWRLTDDGRALSRTLTPELFIDYDVTNWAEGGGYGQMLSRPHPTMIKPR